MNGKHPMLKSAEAASGQWAGEKPYKVSYYHFLFPISTLPIPSFGKCFLPLQKARGRNAASSE